ncbi:MAG: hypothetical protein SNF33_06220 [Candidatus Algichlamydia australiensis]|nr:hypothetical protein [Chlamydiales bacterium]
MSTVVLKFGGSVLKDASCFEGIVQKIVKYQRDFERVVVVVSAMGEMTKELLNLAYVVCEEPPKREQDMLLSVGERISMALLAMALKGAGIEAISFTGSQAGIITCGSHMEARVVDVKPRRLLPHLKAGRVVIVAGFQGVSEGGEITTLGASGSDLTAVALGSALGADEVVFFKDVGGIFSSDPKKDLGAKIQRLLSYEEAFAIAEKGVILQPKAVAFAAEKKLKLVVCGMDDLQRSVVT